MSSGALHAQEANRGFRGWRRALIFAPILGVAANAVWVIRGEQYFASAFYAGLTIAALWPVWAWWIERSQPSAHAPASTPWSRWGGLAFVAVVGIGVLGRTLFLAQFPGPMASVVEEDQTGGTSFGLLRYGGLDPEFPLVNLIGSFGLHWFGRTMNGLRGGFVIWSCLAVPAFIWAARNFYRKEATALLIGLLLATTTYVLSSGRLAMETFSPLATLAFALMALLRARNRGTRAAALIAGAANGLLLIEYFAFRFVGVMNVFWFLLLLAQGPATLPLQEDRRWSSWRKLWAERDRAILFMLASLTIALPCWVQLARSSFMGLVEGLKRNFVEDVAIQAAHTPAGEFIRRAAARIAEQGQSLWFGPSGEGFVVSSRRGILDLPTSVVGLLAIGYILFTCRRLNLARIWPIVMVFLVVVLAGVLTPHTQQYRVFCAVPFFLLGLGIPLDDVLARAASKKIRWQAAAVVLVLVGVNLQQFEVTLRDEEVHRNGYSFLVLVSLEIKKQQDRSRLPIYLLYPQGFPETGGEPSFLYDTARVKFTKQLDEVKGPAVVIACSEQADLIERSPDFHLVGEWQNRPLRVERYVVMERN